MEQTCPSWRELSPRARPCTVTREMISGESTCEILYLCYILWMSWMWCIYLIFRLCLTYINWFVITPSLTHTISAAFVVYLRNFSSVCVQLVNNYRSNEKLIEYLSGAFYGGGLKSLASKEQGRAHRPHTHTHALIHALIRVLTHIDTYTHKYWPCIFTRVESHSLSASHLLLTHPYCKIILEITTWFWPAFWPFFSGMPEWLVKTVQQEIPNALYVRGRRGYERRR